MTTEAEASAKELEALLREKYPSNWMIDTGPWHENKAVRAVLRNPETGKAYTCDFLAKGFRAGDALNHLWAKFPPPSRTDPDSDGKG